MTIAKWVNFLGFVQVAFADVPRDLSFFIIGTMAYRRRWFLQFPTRACKVWLLVGVIAAVLQDVHRPARSVPREVGI